MIIRGRYRYSGGAHRPFLTGYVLAPDGRWRKRSFLLDTGADATFLTYRDFWALGLDLARVEVRDDVGGVGGYGIPYTTFETELRLVSPEGARVFAGSVNIFLDPHATEAPLLGRDVMDHFACIFDRSRDEVLLIEAPDTYQIIRP
jgi:hypothetical protein